MLRDTAPSPGIASAESTAQQCDGYMAPHPGSQDGEKCLFRKDLLWDPSVVTSMFIKVLPQLSRNSV